MTNSFSNQFQQPYTTVTASHVQRYDYSVRALRDRHFGLTVPNTGTGWRGLRWLQSDLEMSAPGPVWGGTLDLIWGVSSVWVDRVNDGGYFIYKTLYVPQSLHAYPYARDSLLGTAAHYEPGISSGNALEVQSHGGDFGVGLGAIFGGSLSNVRSGLTAATTVEVTLPSSFVMNLSSGHVFFVTQSQDITSLAFTTTQTVVRARVYRGQTMTASLAIVWANNIRWPGDTAPVLTANSGYWDHFVFITTNQGSSWVGWMANSI